MLIACGGATEPHFTQPGLQPAELAGEWVGSNADVELELQTSVFVITQCLFGPCTMPVLAHKGRYRIVATGETGDVVEGNNGGLSPLDDEIIIFIFTSFVDNTQTSYTFSGGATTKDEIRGYFRRRTLVIGSQTVEADSSGLTLRRK